MYCVQARLAAQHTSAASAARALPLPGALLRVLPRPARGSSEQGRVGWALRAETRIVLRMVDAERVCKVGGLSYLEAAKVCGKAGLEILITTSILIC